MSDSAEDDRALIARIAGGEQAALDLLYARYRVRLRVYITRRLMPRSERADEVLQDVFLGIWQGAAAYRGEASPAAWIFRIAQHHIAKAQRHLARHAEGYSVPLVASSEDERGEALFGTVPFSKPYRNIVNQEGRAASPIRLTLANGQIVDTPSFVVDTMNIIPNSSGNGGECVSAPTELQLILPGPIVTGAAQLAIPSLLLLEMGGNKITTIDGPWTFQIPIQ